MKLDEAVKLYISAFRRREGFFREKLMESIDLRAFDQKIEFSMYSAGMLGALQSMMLLSVVSAYDQASGGPGSVRRFAEDEFVGVSDVFKEAADIIRAKNVISAAEFKNVSAQIRANSFSVQKIDDFRIVSAIKEKIIEYVEKGLTVQDWRRDIQEIFRVFSGRLISASHAEQVIRTNMNSAYGAAYWDATSRDANTYGYLYSAIIDGRTREDHAALDGKFFLRTDPRLGAIFPPNGYNCRCGVVAYSKSQAESSGFTPQEVAPAMVETVDPDFRHDPGMASLSRKLQELENERAALTSALEKKIKSLL